MIGKVFLPVSTGTVSSAEWSEAYWQSVYDSYVRPTDWQVLPTLTEGQQKIVGLHSVYSHNSNFVAFTISGEYTVDWGDGSATENIAAGGTAYHNFQYESFIGDNETSRGYKQSIVTITPQAGQTLTSVNFDVKHNQSGLQNYKGQWLDIGIVGSSIWGVDLGNGSFTIQQYSLEIFNFIGNNSITYFSNMFSGCYSLQTIPSLVTSAGDNFSFMFQNCYALQTIPLIDTSAGNDFNNMFQNCYCLQTIPQLVTSAVTDFSNMFVNCHSLKNIPLLVTSAVVGFFGMFDSCYSLQTIPLLNTSGTTYFNNMFNNCYALQTIPPIDTSAGTDFSRMFQHCVSLQTISLIDTSKATTLNSMFFDCPSLQIIPLLNITLCTNLGYIIGNCTSLGRATLSGTKVNIDYSNCKLSATELDSIYTNLASGVTNKTITVTGNYGTTSDTPLIATSKGWTVTG